MGLLSINIMALSKRILSRLLFT